MSNTTLEKRIASALADEIASTDLTVLITETETAINKADDIAKAERTNALDPVLSPDATAAREALQAAEFARDRLRNVLPRLQSRLREVYQEEEFARWLPRRNAAMARRDELASKLGEVYPSFVQRIVPLLFEIEEVDREIRLLNVDAPYKAKNDGVLLDSVEHAARGASALQLRHLQIMKDLRLPNWEGAEIPLWPPYRPPNPAVFTPVGGDPRLYAGDW
jgi:hypothetical protein